MTPTSLHELTERLSTLFRRSFRQTANQHDLQLVQLEALVYFATANRYSDTPAGLTSYLGITKGTVSQTIKALERRGFLDKTPDAKDGRVLHCSVTEHGKTVMAEAYPAELFRDLPQETLSAAKALESLLRSIQHENEFRTFGTCHTCRHFEPRSRGGRCGLTGETLTVGDSKKICREHEVPPGTAHGASTGP